MTKRLAHKVLISLIAALAGGLTVLGGDSSQAEPVAVVGEQTETNQTHQIYSVIFETPTGFSEAQSLGSESVGVLFPAEASKGSQQFSVSMLTLEPRFISFLNMEEDELRGYIKYLYLGNQDPSKTYHRRTFFETEITGETQLRRTNRGYSVNEIYLVPLQAGYKVAIFFEADSQMPLMEVERMIDTVTQSLREDPKIVKKRLKKLKKGK